MSAESRSPRLARDLGPLMAVAIVVGTVIGSGIFKKPQPIAQNIPYFGLMALCWILGGLLVFLGALAYAEVVTLHPRAGGNYVFLREGYGRLAGFLWGWVEFFVIRAASLAALATIFTSSLASMLSEFVPWLAGEEGFWAQRFITVAVILGLGLVNVRGVRWGGGLQLAITIVKVASLLGLFALPFVVAVLGSRSSVIKPGNLTPAFPELPQWNWVLLGKFGSAFLGVLWAYHGWMNLAPVAEEVRDPQRNLWRSLLLGTLIIIVLYLSVNLAYALVLSQQELAEMKETVAIGFCRLLLGPAGATLAAAAIMCSVFGALNGNLLVGPRLLYAMGQDGLAPKMLADVHDRYRTPAGAIMVMAGWSSVLVLAVGLLIQVGVLDPKKDAFDVLTDFAMFGAVIFETMAVLSIFIFRWTMPDAERPYRCPGYPIVPLLYVLLPAFILVNMFLHQRQEALIGAGFILVGVVVYRQIGKTRPSSPPETEEN